MTTPFEVADLFVDWVRDHTAILGEMSGNQADTVEFLVKEAMPRANALGVPWDLIGARLHYDDVDAANAFLHRHPDRLGPLPAGDRALIVTIISGYDRVATVAADGTADALDYFIRSRCLNGPSIGTLIRQAVTANRAALTDRAVSGAEIRAAARVPVTAAATDPETGGTMVLTAMIGETDDPAHP